MIPCFVMASATTLYWIAKKRTRASGALPLMILFPMMHFSCLPCMNTGPLYCIRHRTRKSASTIWKRRIRSWRSLNSSWITKSKSWRSRSNLERTKSSRWKSRFRRWNPSWSDSTSKTRSSSSISPNSDKSSKQRTKKCTLKDKRCVIEKMQIEGTQGRHNRSRNVAIMESSKSILSNS